MSFVVIGIPLPLGGIGIAEKTESPQILWNLRAPCDAGPVSRILYGVAAADGHSSRPAITGRLKRPTRKLGAPGQHAWAFFQGLRNGSRLLRPRGRLERSGSRLPLTRPSHSFPIWSCSVWGLPCPSHYWPGGALLPHLFTLTTPDRPEGGMFSVALSVEQV